MIINDKSINDKNFQETMNIGELSQLNRQSWKNPQITSYLMARSLKLSH